MKRVLRVRPLICGDPYLRNELLKNSVPYYPIKNRNVMHALAKTHDAEDCDFGDGIPIRQVSIARGDSLPQV